VRSKVTLILLALNLALFGYLAVSERVWDKTQTIDENRRRVLGPEAANLDELEITAQTAPDAPAVTVRLARDPKGETWSIKEPLDWPANDFAVRRILGELQFLEHETSFPVSELARNEQTLADYGLENPRLVLVATPASPASSDLSATSAPAEPFTLRIGDATAVGERLYVLSPDGTRIHVVGRSLAEALIPDLARLRSDQLLTIPVFETRALTLQTGSTRVRLRRDHARWIFEAPITARAAKTPVELALNSLTSLRVARFLPAAPAPEVTGLSSPRLRVTLEGNARRENLLLGLPVAAPAPDADTIELYASLDDRPTAFTVAVPLRLLETLDRAQTILRDRRVLDLDPSLVTSVTIAAPEPLPSLRIQKLDATPGEPASWQLSSALLPAPLRADADLVDKLLRRLQLLDAAPPRPDSSPFVSDAPSVAEIENLGFNRPERVVTLQLAAAPAAPNAPASLPSTLVLQLAQPVAGETAAYARLVGQPFVYGVAPEIIDALPIAPRLWRDRTLFDLPADTRITRLVIRSATDADAPPILDHAPSDKPAPEAVTTLLNALHDLRARAITGETYPETTIVDGVEKPWAWRLEATLEPAAGGPLVLTLAERTGGMTQQAGSPALGLVFTLEQPVLDALWTLLYPNAQP
jgi:hypothetical protein